MSVSGLNPKDPPNILFDVPLLGKCGSCVPGPGFKFLETACDNASLGPRENKKPGSRAFDLLRFCVELKLSISYVPGPGLSLGRSLKPPL